MCHKGVDCDFVVWRFWSIFGSERIRFVTGQCFVFIAHGTGPGQRCAFVEGDNRQAGAFRADPLVADSPKPTGCVP